MTQHAKTGGARWSSRLKGKGGYKMTNDVKQCLPKYSTLQQPHILPRRISIVQWAKTRKTKTVRHLIQLCTHFSSYPDLCVDEEIDQDVKQTTKDRWTLVVYEAPRAGIVSHNQVINIRHYCKAPAEGCARVFPLLSLYTPPIPKTKQSMKTCSTTKQTGLRTRRRALRCRSFYAQIQQWITPTQKNGGLG